MGEGGEGHRHEDRLMKEVLDFDLISVGGGYAGLVAAARAAELGMKAAVIERGKDELYACNSRFAGGVLHVSYQNPKLSQQELLAAIEQLTAGHAQPELAKAVADNAGRAVDWLRQEGAVFMRAGTEGWRQWILAPPRPPVTHMEWKGRGADVTLRRLEKNLRERGGAVHRDTAAQALFMEDGCCRGVMARCGDVDILYRARSVVLADGGFQGNRALVGQHVSPVPDALKQRGAGTGHGDCMRMAREVGAGVTALEPFYGHILSRDAMHNERVWPYPQLDELAAAGILIDGRAQRIADEGLGGVFLANAIARCADPLSTTVIFDEPLWQKAGRAAAIPPNATLVNAGGTLHRADSIAALAPRIGVSPSALETTIRDYNTAVESGRLEMLEPPRSEKRRKAQRIAMAPFYAAPVCAGLTYTMGGIMIDGHGRVISQEGTAIAGLYAAGAATGGLEGGPAVGYVGGLIKSIVFGLLAAEHAAAHTSSIGTATITRNRA